jgi:hypothetical protein
MEIETVAGTAPVILHRARAPTPRRFARRSQVRGEGAHALESAAKLAMGRRSRPADQAAGKASYRESRPSTTAPHLGLLLRHNEKLGIIGAPQCR